VNPTHRSTHRPTHQLTRALAFFVLAVAIAILAFAAPAQQEDQSSAKSTATAKRKVIRTKGHPPMSGTDPYVKSRTTTSTLESATALDASKLKPKPGSSAPKVCVVHVDNWTTAVVHIFMGGDYTGTVPAGGELVASIPNGASSFYGRIDIDQFDWIPLGPVNIVCDGSYSFTITP
jgi:hypothetical protein